METLTSTDSRIEKAPLQSRLRSLDALRGLDMFFLVALARIFHALASLCDNRVFNFLSQQCSHPEWHGFTAWDMVFPLFIFIVGAAMPFSATRRLQQEGGKKKLYKHIIIRTIVLSILGLVYWGRPGGAHPEWGYYSVLYRIGVSYLFAAIIMLNARPKGQAIWAFALVVGYWFAMRFVPVPGYGAGNFTQEGCLSTFISQKVSDAISPNFKHVLSVTLIPTVSTALFGALAGQWLQSPKSPRDKIVALLTAGIAFIALGFLISLSFPINKKLWSTSFTFLTCGLSILLLCLFYFFIDVREYQKWAFFFVVVGTNSITIYVGSSLIGFDHIANVFIGGFSDSLGSTEPLVLAVTVAAIKWLFLYYLYRHRLFFKI